MVHGRELWGSAAGTGSGRSNKVNHPPGDRGRTGAAEKGDVDGDGGLWGIGGSEKVWVRF